MKAQFKEAIKLHNQGYSPEEIAEEIGVARATAYRWINQHQHQLLSFLAFYEPAEGFIKGTTKSCPR